MANSRDFLSRYPENEKELWQKNNTIMNELNSSLVAVASNDMEKEFVQTINPDGFFPYYTHQKVKILFIAKEALGLYGGDYIEKLFDGILKNDPRGRRWWNEKNPDLPRVRNMTNNGDPFLRKMLYIAYGLNNKCCPYDSMPWASEIGQNLLGKPEGISYAFMNYSKFDNPSETNYSADKYRMQSYKDMVHRTGVNWFAKQITLLNPDIIIEMNIGRDNANALGSKPIEWIQEEYKEDLAVGYLPIEDHKYLLFETWHFSWPGRAFEEHYYLPIVEAWKKYGKK